MLINDPIHHFSDFPKTTNDNTKQFGVPTVFESSVSQRSHDDFALQVESKESMQLGNRCWTERKRRVRRFCDQCCRIDVKRNVIGAVLGVILFRLTENLTLKSHRKYCSEDSQKILFWWMRSPRTSSTKSTTSCSWRKFRSEKIILDWVYDGDPEFEAKKFRIRIIQVTAQGQRESIFV